MGRAIPFMAAALSTSMAGGEQIVIVGQRDAGETKAMWAAANKKYRPFAVLTLVDPSHQQELAKHMPWIAQMKMIDNKATVYICSGFTCAAPSTDPAVLTGDQVIRSSGHQS